MEGFDARVALDDIEGLESQLRSRDVFVKHPGATFVRPRAPFRFHGITDRPLEPAPAAAADRAPAWSPRIADPAAAADAIGDRPLVGVRVLDFTAFWSGPFATAWLAAMGSTSGTSTSTRS